MTSHGTLNGKKFAKRLQQIKEAKELTKDQCKELVHASISENERFCEIVELVKEHSYEITDLLSFIDKLCKYSFEILKTQVEEIETSFLFSHLVEKLLGPKLPWKCQSLSVGAGVIRCNAELERVILELYMWKTELEFALTGQLKSDKHSAIFNLLQLSKKYGKEGGSDSKDVDGSYFENLAHTKFQEYMNRNNRLVPKSPSTINLQDSSGNSSGDSLFLVQNFIRSEDDVAKQVNSNNPWDLTEFFPSGDSVDGTDLTKSMAKLNKLLQQDENFLEKEKEAALEAAKLNEKIALSTLRQNHREMIDRIKAFRPKITDEEIDQLLVRSNRDSEQIFLNLSKDAYTKYSFTPDVHKHEHLVRLNNVSWSRKWKVRMAHGELFSKDKEGAARARLLVDLYIKHNSCDKDKKQHEEFWENFDDLQLKHLVPVIRSVKNLDSMDEIYDHDGLKDECAICTDTCMKSQIFEFSCKHKACLTCLMGNIRAKKNDGHKNLQCLECKSDKRDENQETQLYGRLMKFSRNSEEFREDFDKFDRLLNDNVMAKMEDTTQCAHQPCPGIFVRAGKRRTMTCGLCGKKTCHDCKLPWGLQHKNTSCEKYRAWVVKNHPDWAIPDEVEGCFIVCPECNTKYEMVRGGCLHFVCSDCNHEFCGFCRHAFHSPKRNPCKVCPIDNTKGIHAHHPRNCPYYLRDKEIDWLWKIVEKHNQKVEDLLEENTAKNKKCDLEYVDNYGKHLTCTEDPVERCRGYCEKHFKELISGAIFKAKDIDPVVMMNKNQLKVLADRENVDFEELKDLSDEEIRERLMEEIPLIDE